MEDRAHGTEEMNWTCFIRVGLQGTMISKRQIEVYTWLVQMCPSFLTLVYKGKYNLVKCCICLIGFLCLVQIHRL